MEFTLQFDLARPVEGRPAVDEADAVSLLEAAAARSAADDDGGASPAAVHSAVPYDAPPFGRSPGGGGDGGAGASSRRVEDRLLASGARTKAAIEAERRRIDEQLTAKDMAALTPAGVRRRRGRRGRPAPRRGAAPRAAA